MKADIVVDIETVVDPVSVGDVEAYMKDYAPPANYKLPEAILRHREKTEREAVDTISAERRFSIGGKRMISLALGLVSAGQVVEINSWQGDDLKVLTDGFVNYVNEFGRDEYRLIGWNLKNFDLPEISKSLFLQKTAPKRKPAKWDIIDLCDHPFRKIKLKDAAQAFGLKIMDIDGAAVGKLYQDGDWESIKKYNEHDVYLTGTMYAAATALYSF